MVILTDKAFITLFKAIQKEKGWLHIIDSLKHGGTSRVERWVKEDRIPDAQKYKVLLLFKQEGLIR